MMIYQALRRYQHFAKSIRYTFADDKGGKKGKDGGQAKVVKKDKPKALTEDEQYEKMQQMAEIAGTKIDPKDDLRRKFTGQVKIQNRYLQKTSALYDRYLQVRDKPLVCHDGLLLAYEFVIERVPIFAPYHKKTFEAQRNRYAYAKQTGFYVQLPKDLRLQNGDNVFKQYQESNEQNKISHQIVLSATQKINYRQNSRVWRYTDPNITDPHSIQTHSSNNVFMIVKEKGQWKFPMKLINQKETHSNVFNFIGQHLFQQIKYPIVHFPSKKPMGIRRTKLEGQQKEVRVLTFRGISAFGLPKFPTTLFEDFAWVPKPHFANYFEDKYFEQSAWAATHTF